MNRDSRMREFGDALRVHRRISGLNQAELAARMTDAGHAWHGSTVSKTESGHRAPALTELTALARILTVDLADLLGDAEVMRAERAAAQAAGARMAALLEQVAQIRAEQQQEHRAAVAAAQARIERLERLARELTALNLGDDPRTATPSASSPATPAGAAQRAAPAPGWSR